MTAPPIAPPTGETGFESFEARCPTMFEILCGSRLFWLGMAFWVGSSVGLGIGFLLGVEAVVSR
jgi:hypothetical protein